MRSATYEILARSSGIVYSRCVPFRGSSPPAGGGRAVFCSMYNVYAVYNRKHDKIYIGQTQNLEERLRFHQGRLFKNSFTAKLDGEWQLIYSEEAVAREDALRRERQLKSYRGRQFIKSFIPR